MGIEDELECSMKARFLAEHQNKSTLYPNPLLDFYDVKFYKLDIHADDTTDYIFGNAEILSKVTHASLDTFLVEFSDKLVADSVFLNDISMNFHTTQQTLFVIPDNPILQDSLVKIKIYYHTPENYDSYFFASTKHPNYDNYPVTQTLAEPYYLSEWMPCKQELQDKADSVFVFVTVDTALKVAGPGLLTVVPLGNGEHRYEWRTHHKVAYYLIFFAVSKYVEETRYAKPEGLNGDSILILNYRFDHPYDSNKIRVAYKYSKIFLEVLSHYYGMYPFADEKYGHYTWKPRLFGGMEHITMTGMRHYSLGLTSHEIGHSWFGNNVTCATWQDIWVNEGFATFGTAFLYGIVFSPWAYESKMDAYMNSALVAECGSVYVPENETNSYSRIFSSRLTYHKGASLVHMLRHLVDNDSLFFLSFRNYQGQFKDSVATTEDFRNILEITTGIDFYDFFQQWYYGEGYPIYKLIWEQQGDSLLLEVSQRTSCNVTPLFTIPIDYQIIGHGIDTIVKLQQSSNDTTFVLSFSNEITDVIVDPNRWVLQKVDTVLHRSTFDIKVFPEGAYDTNTHLLTCVLNDAYLPLTNPYIYAPWLDEDTLVLSSIPNDTIVDWVLLEGRETAQGADSALPSKRLFQRACLLRNDGRLVGLDGSSLPSITFNVMDSLYLIFRHRNHLPIMTRYSLPYNHGNYSFDFTNDTSLIYGGQNAVSILEPNVYGVIAADINANDSIQMSDYQIWQMSSGKKGYHNSDVNLDSQSDNKDKNDYWLLQLDRSAILPEYK